MRAEGRGGGKWVRGREIDFRIEWNREFWVRRGNPTALRAEPVRFSWSNIAHNGARSWLAPTGGPVRSASLSRHEPLQQVGEAEPSSFMSQVCGIQRTGLDGDKVLQ